MNSSLEELIKTTVTFILRQGMFRLQNLPKSVIFLTHIRAFLPCKQWFLTLTIAAINVSLLWIFSISLDYLFLSTYFVKCRRTQMELNSKFKSEKKNKFRRCLFTFSIKRRIRHLHVVVVQKWQRNAKIKA